MYFVVPVVLVLSLVLSSGCELITSTESSTTEESQGAVTEAPETQPIKPDWEIPSSENQAPLPSIADVVALVKPSVVSINTEVVSYTIFNQPYTQEGAGSGWIISEEGIIVTNAHVVEGAESITVTLDDGRAFPVDMDTVATDGLTDLAVLKIEAENLTAAAVGDSNRLRVGDWVVAIGNSLGQGIRATQGIVSRKEVRIQEELGQPLKLIETDAAINPGNSGGPLVNMAGEVIGINSVKLVDVQIEGVGYAISSNEAMPNIQQLIANGYIVRPWLGVGLYTVDQFAVLRYRLAVNQGVLITQIADNSPASRAGLQVGDVVVSFGGEEVTNVWEMTGAINEGEIGQEVEISYWRGNGQTTTRAVLAESPPP
jgi:serine protease Do